MSTIIYITGGQRSGKSQFAEKLAKELSPEPVYLATAKHWDEDFTKRIQRHQRTRGNDWITIEEGKHLDSLHLEGKVVLLDCITLWLTNIFHDTGYQLDTAFEQAQAIWATFSKQNFTLIVVSNELGMGMHATDASARRFADLQGWMNQYIAAQSHQAYLMVSGIPLQLK